MRNAAAWALRLTTRYQLDTIVTALLAVGVLGYEAIVGSTDGSGGAAPMLVVVSVVAVAARRRWPFAAAALFAAALFVVAVLGDGSSLDGPPGVLAWVPIDLAYGLGDDAEVWPGLAGVVLLAAGMQATGLPFNPLYEMVTFGPWLAGRAVRSRRTLARRIDERNHQLEVERSRFAEESVRYERGRIARELHDIVAHCLSVVVVQAGAGQRLTAAADYAAAADSLNSIAASAQEARTEIDRLVDMLSGAEVARDDADSHRIDELVQRATATGLTVRYEPCGDASRLSWPTSEAAYRVVQESLTNAIKHAPGAPVDVSVRDAGNQIEVEVVSAAAQIASSGLESSGAGRGLVGLRERVDAWGGTFSAGPTVSGGWRVRAVLPAELV